MASLMHSLEQQYAALTAEVTSKVSQIQKLTGVEKKLLISQVERNLEEAHELLEQMDLEVKGMPSMERQKYQIRLKSYFQELSLLDKEMHSKLAHHEEFDGQEETYDGFYVKDDQRQRLLDNTERLERTSRQLDGGYKLAVEAEQIGVQILSDLNTQRETIKKAKERTHETNYDLGKSSRIVSSMIKGLVQQKIILYVVLSIVLIAIALAIFFTFRKHS